MKRRSTYILVSIISTIIYFLLIYKRDLDLNTNVNLLHSGATIPYWLLLILNVVLFPLIPCSILDIINKK